MKIKSKRPVGITILAIAQIWIGCLNLIFIPLMGFHIWGPTVQRWIEMHLWIRPLATVSEVIVLLVYTGMGVALWKLHPWARRAEIGLIGIGASISIGEVMFTRRPFAILLVAWFCVVYGCIIFYLMRPRVRAAFSDEVRNEATDEAR